MSKPRENGDSWLKHRTGFEDISSKLAPELEQDESTGVLSRDSFEELMDAFTSRASQRQIPLSLALVEFGGDKNPDEEVGEAGTSQEQRLVKVLRRTDPVGRLDGPRFAVLLPGCRGYDMEGVGQRIQRALTGRCELDSNGSAPHVRIGLAESPPHQVHRDGYDLFARARAALEEARCAERSPVTLLATQAFAT